MATADQLADHSWVLQKLKASQDADHDNREHAREANLFVDARDGQWEPHWWDTSKGKPRYSFDLCNPIIDQITGDMEKQDFDIRVTPAGGEASKETAKTYDGLVRNIETISDAQNIYSRAGRESITGGLSGWRVTQKYVEGDSFDQDLVVERIGNYLDRVWFGPHEEPDASDSRYAWVLTGVDPDEFKEKYPDRVEASSLGSDRTANAYYHRHDMIMVGEFLFLKPVKRELVLMSNNKVYEDDEDFKAVIDELEELGVTEVRRRTKKAQKVYSRLFDADGWIGEARETVFENWVPVIPCYANFKVFEDKVLYWGAVEKLIDPQRVFNYSMSREIEEGALAPRQKYWMTDAQVEGHEEELATMNTNMEPIQLFNADPENPGAPVQSGGAQINPGLRNISESMRGLIGQSAGMFAASMGDNPALQSGVAIDALQERGSTGNNKYVTAMEVAQRHTGRILVDSIPRVYEPGRQVRLLQEDGAYDIKTIGEQVPDQQTMKMITLNDLGEGTYDVSCTSGPAFKNRQSETVAALTEIAKVDPSVIEMGGDIMLNNIPSPGMDQLADRKRQQLFQAGVIPVEQMSDAEKAQMQAKEQQPPKEDPMMVAAQAEDKKAQADLISAQTKQAQAQLDAQVSTKKLEIDAFNAETSRYKAEIDKAVAMADIKGKGATAAKSIAEAEAQEVDTAMTISRVTELAEQLNG